PVGVIATLLTLQFIRNPNYGKKSAIADIDWLGIFLLALSVGSLQYVLEKGQDDDWFANLYIILFSCITLLGSFFFLWREMTFRNPIVNLRVLKNGNLRIGTVLTFILGFGLYGSTFIIPIYTQSTLGWTAEQSGMLMVASSITTAFMMPVIGQLLQKGVKQQFLVSFGMLFFAVFCFWGYNILTNDTGSEAFFWMLVVRGAGMAMLFIPITTLSLSTLKGAEIGQGVAFTGMMRQVGGSFGVAIITTFMARQNMNHRSNLVSKLNIYDPLVQNRVNALQHGFMAKGMQPDVALKSAYKAIDYAVTAQANVQTYMDVFYYLGIIFIICIPFILFVKGNKQKVSTAGMH
ncbi:MAG TPA: MFS transporter, partial [Puia sp.]|nr:MFS transporter [Puia sp.]